VSKCANPACPAKFMYLHEGVLYSFDNWGRPQGASQTDRDFAENESVHEYFWLCSQCSWELTLQRDSNGRVAIVPASHGSVFEKSVRAGPSTVTFAGQRHA